MIFWIGYSGGFGDGTVGCDGGRCHGGSVGRGVNVGWGIRGAWVGVAGICVRDGGGGRDGSVVDGVTSGTWTSVDGVGEVEWGGGAGGADV